MLKKAKNLTILSILISVSCGASEPAKAPLGPLTDPLQTSSPPDTPKTTSAAWMAQVQKHLPVLLCQEDQYFMSCFETTKQSCIDLTKVLVEACLNNAKILIPEEIGSQGEYFGEMIGQCSYDLYEQLMRSKKRALPHCQQKTPPLPKKKP